MPKRMKRVAKRLFEKAENALKTDNKDSLLSALGKVKTLVGNIHDNLPNQATPKEKSLKR